jgi:hypothetical protein
MMSAHLGYFSRLACCHASLEHIKNKMHPGIRNAGVFDVRMAPYIPVLKNGALRRVPVTRAS